VVTKPRPLEKEGIGKVLSGNGTPVVPGLVLLETMRGKRVAKFDVAASSEKRDRLGQWVVRG